MRWRQLSSDLKRRAWVLTYPEKWLYRRGLLPLDRLTLPDVLGIGLARCGTTWLYWNLEAHPEIQKRSSHKELHYFDDHFGRPLGWYSAQFGRAAGVRVDVTPGYAHLSAERIGFVTDIMPDAKYIMLFRDPFEQAWSETLRRRVKARGITYEETDEDLVERTLKYVATVTNYVDALDRWQSFVPPEQLFIGFYEDVASRPKEFLTEVFDYIGIDSSVDWAHFPYAERANANKPIPLPPRYRSLLYEINRERIPALRERFGSRAEGWCQPA